LDENSPNLVTLLLRKAKLANVQNKNRRKFWRTVRSAFRVTGCFCEKIAQCPPYVNHPKGSQSHSYLLTKSNI
jgi:hypothetical protein